MNTRKFSTLSQILKNLQGSNANSTSLSIKMKVLKAKNIIRLSNNMRKGINCLLANRKSKYSNVTLLAFHPKFSVKDLNHEILQPQAYPTSFCVSTNLQEQWRSFCNMLAVWDGFYVLYLYLLLAEQGRTSPAQQVYLKLFKKFVQSVKHYQTVMSLRARMFMEPANLK